jgi:hypothetical protein
MSIGEDASGRLAAEAIRHYLATPEAADVRARLNTVGIAGPAVKRIVAGVGQPPDTIAEVRSLKARFSGAWSGDVLERVMLAEAAAAFLSRWRSEALPPASFKLLGKEIERIIGLEQSEPEQYASNSFRFIAAAKSVTLRRYFAGEFDWEISGIPRSVLLKLPIAGWPRVGHFILRRLGGLSPLFVTHVGIARRQASLTREEHDRSFLIMSEALRLQPHILGSMSFSWIRSPDTHAVSPKLAWVNHLFLEFGGLVTTAGRADPEGGVLERSQTRREMYESGRFRPTNGLALWPRAEMLRWAIAQMSSSAVHNPESP